MKSKILLTVTLAIILASCAPMSISMPTETPIPTETLTPVPPSPTATPTITPTPTETPDPNRPSDAMGKDVNGYYKDVQESGRTIRYYWVDLNYGDDIDKSIYKGWFASYTINGNLNGAIPLYDIDRNEAKIKLVPFYYYVQQGKKTPYIKHLGGIPNYANETSYTGFSDQFLYYIMRTYSGKNFWDVPKDEFAQFENDFTSGKISFPFTTPTGDYVWNLTETTGYKFYAIKWDDADPATHPGFYETHSGKFKYRWTIYSDADGNLIVIQALKVGDIVDAENLNINYDDKLYPGLEFLAHIFFPMQQMLKQRQLPAKIKYWDMFGNVISYAVKSKCETATLTEGPDIGKKVSLCFVAQFEIVQNP